MTAFFGQVVINADNYGLTVDATPTTLDSGSWYTFNDTAIYSLVDHLATVITADASSATVTASVSADGFLTLSGTAAFEVTDFDAADLFGFAGDLTGASSYVATKRLEASWIPGRLQSDSLSPVSAQGQFRALVAQQQAADATTYTTEIGELISQVLTFEYISKAKAWEGVDSTRNSFETFFATIRDGRKVLFIPEWEGSSGSYGDQHEYVWNLKDNPAPAMTRQPQTKTTDMYWKIVCNLRGV